MTQPPHEPSLLTALPEELLLAIVERLNVAIFVFDRGFSLREMNAAGRRLLGNDSESLIGAHAAHLDLRVGLGGLRTIEMPVLGEHGDRHILLAWKPDSAETTEGLGNVIHLFVHEANNSLLPIASLASTVSSIARREIASAEAATEVGHALEVIHARALALARFLRACLDFADLPVTTSARFALRPIVERVAALETRLSVVVETQDDVELFGVRDEIEQVLINLVRNAADASLEAGGGVRIRWAVDRGMLDLRVIDDGAGEIDEQALFVPRRTTKRTGLGLGLVLSRYVAVNHGGSLHLQRRRELPGCEAVLRISVGPPLR